MLICQPSQTTIRANDFQNRAYTFSVESALEAVSAPGRLVVSASVGYLLTTSSTNLSRREHTFEHKQQANGTWLATGSVTVICADELPTDGKIVVQNSQSESIVLTVEAPSGIVERSLLPALAASQSTLAFAPTAPDKPSFLVFTIPPQQPNIPVTLTTDLPEVFQLASNSRPKFGPALTVTPSPTGTYVHVRYVSSKPGVHSGQLLLHMGSETKSVALTAYTNGLLPAVLMRARQPALKGLWVGLGMVLIVGSLAFAGYSNRCQFFPSLCQDRIANQDIIKTGIPVLNTPKDAALAANKLDKPAQTRKNRTKMVRPSTGLSSKRDTITKNKSILVLEPQVVENAQQLKALPPSTDKSKPIVRRDKPQPVAPPTQESELERALNRPIPN